MPTDIPSLPEGVERALHDLETAIWALPIERHQEWRESVSAHRRAVAAALLAAKVEQATKMLRVYADGSPDKITSRFAETDLGGVRAMIAEHERLLAEAAALEVRQ